MTRELYDYFNDRWKIEDSLTHFVSVRARLQRPLEVGFNIHSFGDGRDRLDEADRERWSIIEGVDAFMEFSMVGFVSSPEAFAERRCELLVNPLGSRDYIDNSKKGIIGDGWLKESQLLLRLWLRPAASESLLRHIQDKDRRYHGSRTALEMMAERKENSTDWEGDEHRIDLLRLLSSQIVSDTSPNLIDVRFDLCDLAFHERAGQTGFGICRVFV
jgi:hypothetical protein